MLSEFETENVKIKGNYIKDLDVIYGTQKSFYGKAKILEYNNALYLQSYDTIVARIKNGEYTVNGWYSRTTGTHINEFLKQNGFNDMTKKEMRKVS